VRLIKLLVLGGAAAWAYKRFVADSGAGRAETEAAEPFSSEQLDDMADVPVAAAASAPTGSAGSAPADAPSADTLTQPTWLSPPDAG
jgi:hypothetical protein